MSEADPKGAGSSRAARVARDLFESAHRLASFGAWRWMLGQGRVECSAELHRIFGLGDAPLVSTAKDCVSRVHAEDRARVAGALKALVAEGGSIEFTCRILRPDGELRHLRSWAAVLLDEAGAPAEVHGAGVDITELARLHSMELEAAHRRARLVQSVSIAASAASTLDAALDGPGAELAEFLGYSVLGVWRRPKGDEALVGTRVFLVAGSEGEALHEALCLGRRYRPGLGLPGRVLQRHETIWIVQDRGATEVTLGNGRESLPIPLHREDLQRAEAYLEAGFDTGLCVPIFVDGDVAAALEFIGRAPGPPEPDVLDLLEQVAIQLGHVIRRERAQEALRSALDLADAANRTKGRFLASISHEIRTPLNAILGFSELLVRDAADGPHRATLELIAQSSHQLLELVNDVLDVSRIEARQVKLSVRDFGVQALLRELRERYQAQADVAGLRLTTELVAASHEVVAGDVSKLRRILVNLLSNALKFTRQGGVELRVGVEDGGEALRLIAEVEDTGPGIPSQQIDQLFTPFERGPGHQGGTGLGLALSRQLARLMGGDLGLLQRERGACFRLEIPVDRGARVVTEPPRLATPVLGGGPLRVLVVDDERSNRLILTRGLRPTSAESREAANGQEAIEMLAEWRPHVLLLDLRMPEMDGYETTRWVRAREAFDEVCVIVLSGDALEETRDRVLACGADAFLAKPFAVSQLIELIEESTGASIRKPEPAPMAGSTPLRPAEFRAALGEELEDFVAAVRALETDEIWAIIDRVVRPRVAERLRTLMRAFDYEGLLRAVGEAGGFGPPSA